MAPRPRRCARGTHRTAAISKMVSSSMARGLEVAAILRQF
ncbi:Uncharacterised protein [Bordetella pertussis]|nr:Uncharacterised protein [Bordetella pertussis]